MPRKTSSKHISRAVWILSLVSLLTDIASEMLYPILPIYLTGIGFPAAWLGLLEGVAESLAGLSKGWFGALSDRLGRRSIFIKIGYFLSAAAKPTIGFATHPAAIFLLRTIDRFGKGVRTASRDAILAEESRPENRARVFSFHRGMDTLGASIGPLVALMLLWKFPEDYRRIFLWSIPPGIAAVALSAAIRDKKRIKKKASAPSFRNRWFYWRAASKEYRHFTVLTSTFALVNSSDMFLLVKMKTAGLGDMQVIGIYILFNAVYAALAYPFGALGDKFGPRRVLAAGLCMFGVVYCGFGIANSLWALIALIILYGAYNAATQGITGSVIASLCESENRALGIGTYFGLQSACSLAAGLLAGVIWSTFGAAAMFAMSGIAALLIAPLILRFKTIN